MDRKGLSILKHVIQTLAPLMAQTNCVLPVQFAESRDALVHVMAGIAPDHTAKQQGSFEVPYGDEMLLFRLESEPADHGLPVVLIRF